MDKDNEAKYKKKAEASFKTKLNLFLFQCALNEKTSFKDSEFEEFQINEELVKKYTTQYWQWELHEEIENKKIEDLIKSIDKLKEVNKETIKKLKLQYIKSFDRVFSKEDFEKLLDEKECHYCKITEDRIENLCDKGKLFKKSTRGWSLEIDRLDSNYEYTKNNCVKACYWCNNAKTDEFTEAEFLKIGNVIKEIWEERLK
ncbi:MAG: hypothetical protein ACQER7_04365 [Bacteroidota bacterium]